MDTLSIAMVGTGVRPFNPTPDTLQLWNYRPRPRLDPDHPQPVEEIVDVREAVLLVHDDAPRHRLVLRVAVHVARVDARDLAALLAQIAAQLTGNVEGAEAAVVHTHVERVARDPHV